MAPRRSVILKCAAAAAIATGLAYLAYRHYTQQTQPPKQQQTISNKNDKVVTRSLNLQTASREDIIEILRDIASVQKQLTALIDAITRQIVLEKLDIVEVYKRLMENEPEDPLKKHGLNLTAFDVLLERFSADKDVSALLMEVLQAPEGEVVSYDESRVERLTTDEIVEINAAMCEKMKEVAAELDRRGFELPGEYEPRLGSLTAQTVAAAFIEQKYNVSSATLERAMTIKTYELSNRRDYMKINEDVQAVMESFTQREKTPATSL